MQENLIKEFCNYWKIDFNLLISKTRQRDIKEKRQLLALILYNLVDLNYSEVKRILGHKQHHTVMNACKIAQGLVDTDKEFAKCYIHFQNYVDNYQEIDIEETIKSEVLKFLINKYKEQKEINTQLKGVLGTFSTEMANMLS